MTPTALPLPHVTAQIVLRRFEPADLRAFQDYRNDPEVGRFQGWSAKSDDEALEFLNEMNAAPLLQPGEWCQIAIAAPESLALIGDIGLLMADDGDTVEIGFTLAPAHQGRGLATAAVRETVRGLFKSTGAARVIGVADVRNAASLRLMERIGMRRTHTAEAVFRGEPCVEHTYTITR